MIKNLNVTISLLALIIICFFTIKIGLGLIFSSNRTATYKGNFYLLRQYKNNEEE